MHWWCIVVADSAGRVERAIEKIFGEPYTLGDWATIGGRYEHLQPELDNMGITEFIKGNVDMNDRAWSPIIWVHSDDSWGLRDINTYLKYHSNEKDVKYFIVDYHH
jgi:hypothetical protein